MKMLIMQEFNSLVFWFNQKDKSWLREKMSQTVSSYDVINCVSRHCLLFYVRCWWYALQQHMTSLSVQWTSAQVWCWEWAPIRRWELLVVTLIGISICTIFCVQVPAQLVCLVLFKPPTWTVSLKDKYFCS